MFQRHHLCGKIINMFRRLQKYFEVFSPICIWVRLRYTGSTHLYTPNGWRCVMIFWQATVDRQNRTSILVWLTLPRHRLLEIRSQAAQNSISQHRNCPVHRFYITSSNAQKYSQSQVIWYYDITYHRSISILPITRNFFYHIVMLQSPNFSFHVPGGFSKATIGT